MPITRGPRSWPWPGTWQAGGSSTPASAPAPLFAALRDRGAIVTGFDSSTGMLEQAPRRLGDGADLQVAALGRPLPFPDGAFDDVIAALVLHYLEDSGPALAELRRVLKPGGQADRIRRPSLCHPRAPAPGRAQDRLFRHLQLDRGLDHGRPDRPDELLETGRCTR